MLPGLSTNKIRIYAEMKWSPVLLNIVKQHITIEFRCWMSFCGLNMTFWHYNGQIGIVLVKDYGETKSVVLDCKIALHQRLTEPSICSSWGQFTQGFLFFLLLLLCCLVFFFIFPSLFWILIFPSYSWIIVPFFFKSWAYSVLINWPQLLA